MPGCRLHVIPAWSSFYPPRPTPAGVTPLSGIFSSHVVCENAEGLPVFLTLLREINLLTEHPGGAAAGLCLPRPPRPGAGAASTVLQHAGSMHLQRADVRLSRAEHLCSAA